MQDIYIVWRNDGELTSISDALCSQITRSNHERLKSKTKLLMANLPYTTVEPDYSSIKVVIKTTKARAMALLEQRLKELEAWVAPVRKVREPLYYVGPKQQIKLERIHKALNKAGIKWTSNPKDPYTHYLYSQCDTSRRAALDRQNPRITMVSGIRFIQEHVLKPGESVTVRNGLGANSNVNSKTTLPQ